MRSLSRLHTMKFKTVLIWPLGILAAFVMVFPVLWIADVLSGTTILDVAVPEKVHAEQSGPGLPIHLTIQKINVDALVEYMGLTPQGAMAVPKGPVDVGWYSLGPRPGEVGSAVLAGHEGWKDAQPAVFDTLHTLSKGDSVSVEDDKGVTISFVVREIRTYNQIADASSVFGSTDGKAHLNLITCEGVWDPSTKTYANRLVVFTDKE